MEGGIWGEKCDINILLQRVSQILKSGKHYENTLQAHLLNSIYKTDSLTCYHKTKNCHLKLLYKKCYHAFIST